MRTNTAARSITLVLLLVLALGACGDDGTDDTLSTKPPEATGGTGTVPIAGPADWLTWTPAEAPGAEAEATLVAALEELDMAMIIPVSPPPDGGTTSAVFNSHSLGYGSGETFAGSTHISINIERGEPNFVIVTTPPWETPCGEGAVTVSFRGDDAACTIEAAEISEVWWFEAGQSFHASFRHGLTLSEGLAWLETWRLLP
jgi:hypothetical protein